MATSTRRAFKGQKGLPGEPSTPAGTASERIPDRHLGGSGGDKQNHWGYFWGYMQPRRCFLPKSLKQRHKLRRKLHVPHHVPHPQAEDDLACDGGQA